MASPVSRTTTSPASDSADSAVLAHPPRLRRIARSFRFALEGLATMVRSQPNFLVHLSAAVLALAAGVVFRLSPTELALLVLTIAFVLVTECVNTVLETLCDLVSPSFHPLVKRAKDVAAGAVLIGAIASVGVGLLLFGPRVLAAV